VLHKLNILTTQFSIFSQYYQYLQTCHDQLFPHTLQLIIHHHINTVWNKKKVWLKKPQKSTSYDLHIFHIPTGCPGCFCTTTYAVVHAHCMPFVYSENWNWSSTTLYSSHKMVRCSSRELNIWIWSCFTWYSNMNCSTWINTVTHVTFCFTLSQTPCST
jgi:hypothetical protein